MPKAIETIVSAKDKRRFSLRAQSEDLTEARKALESAANISRGLWITFMSLAAGVFITTGTVTHRDLFLEKPVKLPLLNADLPIVAFFWVAPLMFILFHSYLLLNLTSLGANVRHYFDLVDDTGLDPKSKNKLYLQLPNFMVVQMLRARREKYWSMMGYALHVVVALTLVVGPLVALLLLQVKFLPYHSHEVIWVQRGVILLDAAAIFYFWPEIVGRPASLLVWYVRMLLYAVVMFIFLFSWFVARFPGESYYDNGPFESSGIAKWLFRGEVDRVTGKPESFFSDRLVLANEDFIDLDDDKLSAADKTLSLRGRDLVGAYLARTDLRKADFTGADMKGVDFSSARLQDAIFINTPAELVGKVKRQAKETILKGVKFTLACMNGANFKQADIRRAIFGGVNLDGATLEGAQLQGAVFSNSSLLRTNLRFAYLKGATIRWSDMRRANLERADLTGVSILQSRMQGVILKDAMIPAATFVGNQVRGLFDGNIKWDTTLVADITDDGPDLAMGEARDCVPIAQTSTQPENGIDTALPKAASIEAYGVSRFPENATDFDRDRWRSRIDSLKNAICDDSQNGTDVLNQIVNASLFGNDRDIQLGPFKRETAAMILDIQGCKSSPALPKSLKSELECWRLLDEDSESQCVKDTRAKATESQALP